MIVEHEGKHLPSFVFVDPTLNFPSADLFVESVQKLLACRSSSERSTVMERTAKSAKIEQAFARPRERHSHAIEKIDDLRGHVAHSFYRRLICEKVAAVYGVVEM